MKVKCVHETSGISWGQIYEVLDMANGKVKTFDNSGSVVWVDSRCFEVA